MKSTTPLFTTGKKTHYCNELSAQPEVNKLGEKKKKKKWDEDVGWPAGSPRFSAAVRGNEKLVVCWRA